MLVAPGKEFDGEIHAEADQFFHIEQGRGLKIADAMTHEVKLGDCAGVTVGAYHNLFCAGHDPLEITSSTGSPNHRDQMVQKTTAELAAPGETFEAKATEQAMDVVRI